MPICFHGLDWDNLKPNLLTESEILMFARIHKLTSVLSKMSPSYITVSNIILKGQRLNNLSDV